MPPVVGPDVGDTDEKVGAPVEEKVVNALTRTSDWPFGFRTATVWVPTDSAGVVTRSSVELTKVTLAETPPTVTVAPDTKYEPFSVKGIPPEAGPDVGAIEVREGDVDVDVDDRYVNASPRTSDWPSVLVTRTD